MSDAASKPMTELKVTAHLMRLDIGTFCIVQTPSGRHIPDPSGLPGVRIAVPPDAPPGVTIASFRPDGWLSGQTDAAIVRVTEPNAQLLITIYQNIGSADPAPRLQVIRLGEEAAPRAAVPARGIAPPPPPPRSRPEIVAHQQVKGDVGAMLGDWIGDRGSKRWIEGFMIVPRDGLTSADIEYQAVLGRGWLSPWSEGGSLCGSRGMSLPILGLRVRLRGEAADKYDIGYEATFVDGSTATAVMGGEPCEAATLSPLEAFRIIIAERETAVLPKPAARPAPKALPPAKAPLAKAPPARRGR
jgi:hypothetical protein